MHSLRQNRQRKTHQMTLRLRPDQIEALDRINRLKYHDARSRTSLIEEAIWLFIEHRNLNGQP
jgi:hypothetical protein